MISFFKGTLIKDYYLSLKYCRGVDITLYFVSWRYSVYNFAVSVYLKRNKRNIRGTI